MPLLGSVVLIFSRSKVTIQGGLPFSKEAQRGQDGVDNVKSATAKRNPLVRSRRDSTVLTMPPKKSTAVNRAVKGGTQGRL
jgi:hypothetical protein